MLIFTLFLLAVSVQATPNRLLRSQNIRVDENVEAEPNYEIDSAGVLSNVAAQSEQETVETIDTNQQADDSESRKTEAVNSDSVPQDDLVDLSSETSEQLQKQGDANQKEPNSFQQGSVAETKDLANSLLLEAPAEDSTKTGDPNAPEFQPVVKSTPNLTMILDESKPLAKIPIDENASGHMDAEAYFMTSLPVKQTEAETTSTAATTEPPTERRTPEPKIIYVELPCTQPPTTTGAPTTTTTTEATTTTTTRPTTTTTPKPVACYKYDRPVYPRQSDPLPANIARFANIDYLGKGYDIFRGNPEPAYSTMDPGFKASVFDMSRSRLKRTTVDRKYALPDNADVRECRSCEYHQSMRVINSSFEYTKHLQASVQLSIKPITFDGFPLVEQYLEMKNEDFLKRQLARIHAKLAFSRNQDFQGMLSMFASFKSVVTVTRATCSAYCAEVDLLSVPAEALSDHFYKTVQNLDVSSDDSFLALMLNYGTHFVSNAKMGSKVLQRLTFREADWNLLWQSGNQVDSNIPFAVQYKLLHVYSLLKVAGQMGIDRESASSLALDISAKALSVSNYALGAIPSEKNPSRWGDDSMEKAMPITIDVKLISELMVADFFPNDKMIGLKRERFERILADGTYCNYLMKLNGEKGECENFLKSLGGKM